MALSQYDGSSSKPFVSSTYWGILDEHCNANPDKEAMIMYDSDKCFYRATFKELRNRTWQVAAIMKSRFPELDVGDRIGIIGSNRPELLHTELAAYRLGLCAVFLPTGLQDLESLVTAIQMTKCRGLVFENSFINSDQIKEILTRNPNISFGVCFDQNQKRSRPVSSVYTWNDLFNAENVTDDSILKAQQQYKNVKPEMAAVAYFTSGTTGFPKAVLHSHFALVNSQIILGEMCGWDQTTKFFQDRPLSAGGGGIFATRLIGIFGCTSVTLKSNSTSDPSVIYNIVEKEKANQMMLFGYMLYDFIASPESSGHKLRTLQTAVIGGQVIDTEHADLLSKHIQNLKIINVYGATEMNVVVISEPTTTPGFSGKPVRHVEAKVVVENDKTATVGQPGELVIRSPFFMLGYLTHEGKKMPQDSNGWYHTDDNAIMNEHGEIKLLGRRSDVIKRAAQLIFPIVIEKVIEEHHKVQGVHVVGVTDVRLYEEICACVVPSDSTLTENELREWCHSKFKVDHTGRSLEPKFYIFMKEFPRMVSGKTDRRKLKALAGERFHLIKK